MRPAQTTNSSANPIRGRANGSLVRARGFDNALLATVDLLLAASVFVVPFAMGGRQALGSLCLQVIAGTAFVIWQFRQFRFTSSASHSPFARWILLATLAVLTIQIIPLPDPLWRLLSPHAAHLLPAWNSAETFPLLGSSWNQLSLAPAATREALFVFAAYAALFVVAAERIRDIADVERILCLVAAVSFSMAVFGLVQYLFSNGRFFWFYDHPYTHTSAYVKGSFTNRNHFAQCIALGVGPMAWCIQKSLHDSSHRRHSLVLYYCAGLCVMLFSLALSLSRGGALAAGAALVVSTSAFIAYRRVALRNLIIPALVLALLVAMLQIHGRDTVANRLDDLTAGDVEQLDDGHGRRRIWTAVLLAIPKFAFVGSGVGTHSEIYPTFFPHPIEREFTHAENSYLQVVLETGIGGLILTCAAIALASNWLIRALVRRDSPRHAVAAAAIAASAVANLLHAVIDFVWYVPGCMVIVTILAAAASRLAPIARGTASRDSETRFEMGRLALASLGFAATAVALILGSGSVRAERYWHAYLKCSLNEARQDAPGDELSQVSALGEFRRRRQLLEETVRRNPDHHRAHLRLAAILLQEFEALQRESTNPLGVMEIRDAAVASRFESRQALDEWLGRAVGPHRHLLGAALAHARHALRLCPLDSSGYLYAAELAFLEEGNRQVHGQLLKQALAVRPYDGNVHLELGKEALLVGRFENALEHWKNAFDRGPEFQQRLVDMLASRVPPEFFLQQFEMDLPAIRTVVAAYHNRVSPDQFRVLATQHGHHAESAAVVAPPTTASGLWIEAHRAYVSASDIAAAASAAREAINADRNHFSNRVAVATFFLEHRMFDEAAEHLHWCQQRRPHDEVVRRRVEALAMQKRQLETNSTSASAPPSVATRSTISDRIQRTSFH